MSDSDHEPKVGYGLPPVKSRWKKGQCGNPNRKRRRRPPTMKEMIDSFFSTEIWVTENGVRRRCSAFEAIVSQLCIKADAGNRRAARALLRYVEFTKGQGGSREIIFATQNDDGSVTRVGSRPKG
jgi:hypothetical protein